MENEEKVMTEEEIRNDLIDQMMDAEDSNSDDPVEISNDGDDSNLAAKIAVGGGIAAALVTGGIVLGKRIKAKKDKKSEEAVDTSDEAQKPNLVKRMRDSVKNEIQLAKKKSQTIKEIKADTKEKIKAVKHPIKEKVSEIIEVVDAEIVDNKETSKKK